MNPLMSKEQYRDLLAWSLQERDGLSWDQAVLMANADIDEHVQTLQEHVQILEDRRFLEMLDSMLAESVSD